MARDELPEIWLIEDENVCYSTKTGKAVAVYKFVSKGREPDKSTVRSKFADDASLDDLVELCDQDAESVNAHDYCGAHRLLGAVLYLNLGRPKATAIMKDIALRRGLHGMNGLCGIPDSYAALDVGESGRTWSGGYGV